MFFDTFDGFFIDNISGIGKYYTQKEQAVYVKLKAKYIEKKKKEKKKYIYCGLLRRFKRKFFVF